MADLHRDTDHHGLPGAMAAEAMMPHDAEPKPCRHVHLSCAYMQRATGKASPSSFQKKKKTYPSARQLSFHFAPQQRPKTPRGKRFQVMIQIWEWVKSCFRFIHDKIDIMLTDSRITYSTASFWYRLSYEGLGFQEILGGTVTFVLCYSATASTY